MRKKPILGIMVGHTQKRGGAYSKQLKTNEYDYMGMFSNLLCIEGHNLGVNVVPEWRDKGGVKGAYRRLMKDKPDAIIELHFNAATPKATGTETLYCARYDRHGVDEIVFAKMINDSMVKALGLRDRGIKRRAKKGERGFFNLMQTKRIPSILIEPFFGSNSNDAKTFDNNKRKVAKSMIQAFIKWSYSAKSQ